MRYIAIDLGSSFIKVALLDLSGSSMTEAMKYPVPGRISHPDPRRYEIDARALFHSVKNIVDRYLERYEDIAGLVMSTQMHGFVLVDGGSEEDRYISWQDTRCLDPMPGEGKSYLEYLEALVPAGTMRDTGVRMKPALGLCNLYTIMKERNAGSGGNATLYTLGSYINAGFTGRNITHITNAAPLGFVDIRAGVWHRDVVGRTGLGELRLPEIATGFVAVGRYEHAGKSIVIYPDLGDQQATVLGCDIRPGEVVVNVGTASQIAYVSAGFSPGDYETRPYFEGTFLNTVSRMPGGRNLDVLVGFIQDIGEKIYHIARGPEPVWEYFNESFTLGDPAGLGVDSGFYELPDKLADGHIGHIHKSNLTLDNLFSATLIDMARVYRHYIGILCGGLDRDSRLVFSGGVSWRNPMLLRAVALETGHRVELSPMRDEVFAGLFRTSLVCSGRCGNLGEAAMVPLSMER